MLESNGFKSQFYHFLSELGQTFKPGVTFFVNEVVMGPSS